MNCPWCLSYMMLLDSLGRGLSSPDVEAICGEFKLALRRAIWGDGESRGRGRKTSDLVWTKGRRGGTRVLRYPADALRRTRLWLNHLSETEIENPSDLEDHLSEDVPEKLRTAAKGLKTDPKNGGAPTSRATALDVLSRVVGEVSYEDDVYESRLSARDTVRVTLRRHGREWVVEDVPARQWLEIADVRPAPPWGARPWVLHRRLHVPRKGRWEPDPTEYFEPHEVVLPSVREPGAKRLFCNLDTIEARHPGTLPRFVEELEQIEGPDGRRYQVQRFGDTFNLGYEQSS